MSKILKKLKTVASFVVDILGVLNAVHLTLCMLIYVILFQILGKYKFDSRYKLMFVWRFDTTTTEKNSIVDKLLNKFWSHSGHAIGNICVIKSVTPLVHNEQEKKLLVHEYEHTRQSMKFGTGFIMMYIAFYIFAKLALNNVDPYRDNPFEISARNTADKEVFNV